MDGSALLARVGDTSMSPSTVNSDG